MKIIEITASAGRTVPHPDMNYAALRSDLSVRATVEDDRDPEQVAAQLQEWVRKATQNEISRMRRERDTG